MTQPCHCGTDQPWLLLEWGSTRRSTIIYVITCNVRITWYNGRIVIWYSYTICIHKWYMKYSHSRFIHQSVAELRSRFRIRWKVWVNTIRVSWWKSAALSEKTRSTRVQAAQFGSRASCENPTQSFGGLQSRKICMPPLKTWVFTMHQYTVAG